MQQYISIDFKTNSSAPEQVIDQRVLSFNEEKLFGLVTKPVKIKWARLAIADVQIPSSVKVKNLHQLIGIRMQVFNPETKETTSELYQEFRDFLIIQREFPFSIVLSPAEIEDYTDFSQDEQLMTFKLVVQDRAEHQAETYEYQTKLVFNKARCVPKIEFISEQNFQAPFEYRKEQLLLGKVLLQSVSDVTYAEPLSCQLRVSFNKKDEGDIVTFGNLTEIEETNPHQSFHGGFMPEEEEMLYDVEKTRDPDNRGMDLRNVIPNNLISIPVYIDLARLSNPASGEVEHDFNITIWINGAESDRLNPNITLTPDTRTTALKVILQADALTEPMILNSAMNVSIPGKFQWLWQERRGSTRVLALQVGNNAQNGNGAVEIKNFKFQLQQPNDSPSVLKAVEGDKVEDAFLINNNPFSDLELPDATIRDGDRPIELEIAFRHAAIQAIPDDLAVVTAQLSFDYKTSGEQDFSAYEASLKFQVERNLGRHWLALDFGTSAIVTAYDDGSMDSVNVSNLQSILSELVKDYNQGNVDEYNTNFLSSMMILGDHKYIEAGNYKEDIVQISPTLKDSYTFYMFIVPYLKSLIGTEYLPNVNKRLDNLAYKVSKENSSEPFLTIKGDKNLIKVDVILRNAYRSLLRDFVMPLIKRSDDQVELNKIIFTIPNTFTPRHVDYIKQLTIDNFKHFRKDYIAFLSESDAVACYYFANWHAINAGRPAEEIEALSRGTEYVLVYDMGAGTLDITYLRITTERSNNRSIEIIGRLGKTTAGNYFDYTIAEAIVEQVKADPVGKDRMSKAVLTPTASDQGHVEAFQWKKQIKDRIKPLLSNNSGQATIDMEIGGGPNEVGSKAITMPIELDQINSFPSVKEYIQKNTSELLENFFRLFQRFDNVKHEKSQFPLHTLIFSGRGSQYGPLRDALKKELAKWVNNNNPFYIENLSSEKLKSVVVEGALKYATTYRDNPRVRFVNPNLQARYGILYVDPRTNRLQFKELLNPGTRSINDKPIVREGFTIYQYDTDVFDADPGNDNRPNVVDLSLTPVAYFVQSYSLQTAEDWANKNTEYISEMFRFPKSQISGSATNVPIRLVINQSNEMVVTIGSFRDDPRSSLTLDRSESSTFRKSMWPYLD